MRGDTCQLLKSPTRAPTRFWLEQETENRSLLIASCVSVPLPVPDLSVLPTVPRDIACCHFHTNYVGCNKRDASETAEIRLTRHFGICRNGCP